MAPYATGLVGQAPLKLLGSLFGLDTVLALAAVYGAKAVPMKELASFGAYILPPTVLDDGKLPSLSGPRRRPPQWSTSRWHIAEKSCSQSFLGDAANYHVYEQFAFRFGEGSGTYVQFPTSGGQIGRFRF